MAINKSYRKEAGGCIGFIFMLLLLFITSFGSILYLETEPKDRIKEEIIKKGDTFSVDSKDLSKYIDVLEDLNLSYKTSKDSDGAKTVIKIDRSNK